MSKSSYTPEFRAKVAQEYLDGNCSRKDLSEKYNIPESTIRDWINVYKTHGINAFINTKGNKQYTKDFKIQCVEAVLKGESSVLDVVSQYQISSHIVIYPPITLIVTLFSSYVNKKVSELSNIFYRKVLTFS